MSNRDCVIVATMRSAIDVHGRYSSTASAHAAKSPVAGEPRGLRVIVPSTGLGDSLSRDLQAGHLHL